jgi:uncharacterized SAM-dependent methyltransferase
MRTACILFLAANPDSTVRLTLDEESRDIEERLRAAKHRDAFQYKTRWAVRPDDLQDALLREEPTVVHFSGHGSGPSGLILYDDDGNEKPVAAEALRHLFSVLKGKIRLVVLNACYSEEQAKAIVQEIDFVVGMEQHIGDEAARKFAASFYRALGFGRSVKTAFELGVSSIKLHDLGDHSSCPVLLVRAGLDPDSVVLVENNDVSLSRPVDAAQPGGGGLSVSEMHLSGRPLARVTTEAPHPADLPGSSQRAETSSSASRWEIDFNAIMRLPTNDPWRWTVVLSRDEASRHGDLMISLRRAEGETKPRFIDSGFAYWGIGPTIEWRRACQDSFYTVMRKGIDTFPGRWTELLGKLERRLPCIYVSYGVGTGEKDRAVLGTMSTALDTPVYVPADISLDMLVNGARVASKDVIESSKIIPLQIDFSSAAELVTLSEIRKKVFGDRPVLFSLLGNTLANFENDVATLNTLAELVKKGDLFAIELAATKMVGKDAASTAAAEYRNIPSFENFVRSALTQHTDLPINKIDYHCEVCHDDGALQIDIDYVSTNRGRGRLIDGSMIELRPKERIRLYRSRKYTHEAIKRILRQAGLTEVCSDLHWNDRSSPFGLYLGICGKTG